jgi:hypothetical protein
LKSFTQNGAEWFAAASGVLRPDQAQELEARARAIADRRHAPKVGGIHIIKALGETGLYQRGVP